MTSTLKSVLAVVLGFVATGALVVGTTSVVAGRWPAHFDADGNPITTAMILINLAYVGVFAIFGCWLAGRLAPNRPMRHAMIVGLLGLLLNVGLAVPLWGKAPSWALVAGALAALLWAWIGGRIAETRPAPAAV